MLALASLTMSLLLKLIETAARTKIGLFGIGGFVAAAGGFAIGWAVMKLKELWHLSELMCDCKRDGWFLFSWFKPSMVARSHEVVINWVKMQGPEIQKQYRDALVG